VAYKLEHLDRLVTDSIQGNLGERFTLSEIDITRILHEALQETEKLKALLVEEVFSFTKEKEIEVYIKNYQISLTHLLDRLYGQQQQLKEPAEEGTRFYQNLFKLIQALLSFIEERFSKYFDKDGKVPDVYLALTREEIQNKLVVLFRIIQQDSPGDLISGQIIQRLTAFSDSPRISSLTYRDIMFYKELVKELEDLDQWGKGESMYSGIQQLLIYLNYNDKEFINAMVNQLNLELRSIDELNDKIDRLLIYSKEMNQLQLKPDSGFLARHPSVKNQLSNWFAEELAYLERKLKGFQTIVPLPSMPYTESSKSKVICHLPVDQIGIFFRAATDIQIITSPSQKALFDKIAPWLSTPYRLVLSAESMRSKSYSPEKRDQEALKDILMKLFRQVGKY
jgi:hypothetical protein